MHHVFDEIADYQLARRAAGRFKRNKVFWQWDTEDLTLELATHLWRQTPKFDPAKGSDWEAFAWAVMTQRGRALIRVMNNGNERGRREHTVSLDAEIGETENGDPIFFEEILGDGSPDMANEAAFRMDREAAMTSLTDKQREVADHMENGTKTQLEMAEEMGIPRTTFQYRYSDPVRRVQMSLIG